MPRPNYRFRRLLTLLAAALALGVAVHGACQAIEHHDGAKEALALCAAAVALIGAVRLGRLGGNGEPRLRIAWASVALLAPSGSLLDGWRTSPAWLSRFQN